MTDEQREKIKAAIAERSPIDVDGEQIVIEFIKDDESLVGPKQFALRFQGTTEAKIWNADLQMGEWNINDAAYIADNAIAAVRDVITGALPPGTKELM